MVRKEQLISKGTKRVAEGGFKRVKFDIRGFKRERYKGTSRRFAMRETQMTTAGEYYTTTTTTTTVRDRSELTEPGRHRSKALKSFIEPPCRRYEPEIKELERDLVFIPIDSTVRGCRLTHRIIATDTRYAP